MKVDSRFKHYLYKNSDPIQALNTYEGILENYLLIHNQNSIGVFRHRRHKGDLLVWNVIKPWEEGHSHFKSQNVAVMIANNVALNRKPKRNMCTRNLASYPRIATSEYKYLDWVNNLIETKKDKIRGNNYYINVGKAI